MKSSDGKIDEQASTAHDLFDQTLDFVGGVEEAFAELTTDLAVALAVIGLKEKTIWKFQQGDMKIVFVEFESFAGLFEDGKDFAVVIPCFSSIRKGWEERIVPRAAICGWSAFSQTERGGVL